MGPVPFDKIETRIFSVKLFHFWGPLLVGVGGIKHWLAYRYCPDHPVCFSDKFLWSRMNDLLGPRHLEQIFRKAPQQAFDKGAFMKKVLSSSQKNSH